MRSKNPIFKSNDFELYQPGQRELPALARALEAYPFDATRLLYRRRTWSVWPRAYVVRASTFRGHPPIALHLVSDGSRAIELSDLTSLRAANGLGGLALTEEDIETYVRFVFDRRIFPALPMVLVEPTDESLLLWDEEAREKIRPLASYLYSGSSETGFDLWGSIVYEGHLYLGKMRVTRDGEIRLDNMEIVLTNLPGPMMFAMR